MNKQQIIDSAMQMAAGIGGDPLQSPVIDGDMTAEDLLPLAFRHAYKELISTGQMRLQDVIRAHTIECVDADAPMTGLQGDLPEGVLTEHLDHAFLPDFPYSAFMQYLPDYNREKFTNLLCYFTVNNGVFYTTCGFSEDASSEESGESSEESEEPVDVILHAPSTPVIPSNPATEISMPDAARDAVIMTLARALRGEIALVQ